MLCPMRVSTKCLLSVGCVVWMGTAFAGDLGVKELRCEIC